LIICGNYCGLEIYYIAASGVINMTGKNRLAVNPINLTKHFRSFSLYITGLLFYKYIMI